uniref:Immunoglobulin domain-containing protein n=1 Tax=Gasterosteus aculeatus aculeatus TaxID=481459 RepID=G3Q8C4_GASAC
MRRSILVTQKLPATATRRRISAQLKKTVLPTIYNQLKCEHVKEVHIISATYCESVCVCVCLFSPAVPSGVICEFVFPPGDQQLVCLESIRASEGEDVTLRCHSHPKLHLDEQTVEVSRDDLPGRDNIVHLYRDRKDDFENQMTRYRDRTRLDPVDLTSGNVTLRICSVDESDSGRYVVFIPKLHIRDQQLVCLESIRASEGEDVTLRCHSHPKLHLDEQTVEVRRDDLPGRDNIVHLYRDRKDDFENQMTRYRDRTRLDPEDLTSGKVTLRICSVNESDSGHYVVFIPKLDIWCVINVTISKLFLQCKHINNETVYQQKASRLLKSNIYIYILHHEPSEVLRINVSKLFPCSHRHLEELQRKEAKQR